MENEKLYSFTDLGFQGFVPVLVPNLPNGGYRYTNLKIVKNEKAVRDFMLRCMLTFLQTSGKNDYTGEFFGGVAYMKDGSLITIFNGINGEENKLFFKDYEPDFYQSVEAPEGVILKDNQDYIRHLFNSRLPKALVLLQEISGEEEDAYYFRIVHEKNEDQVRANF